ncbi:probable serine/threonine-protein kinase kinX isoform X1 [Dicentrarchus labrax]|uniref:Si:dkey-23f9.4 n=1 Tax=Dicentrarchus labrax TaxID=13489 RepID=A0A8C4HTP5_DICLA|nr:probable serine/threonine-protein kinase kinX isoform X1 [Dicentrarchus labrax]
MYKMYNTQWDDESDDDKDCLNSSFWSDVEPQEEEEEVVEIEQVIDEQDSKPVGGAEDSLREASEEEKPELNEANVSRESLEGGSDGDGDDEDEEESGSSSCDSPAPSLMTSGYGTYRPEEQEAGDYRDDHSITEFDQDSRGDLSETRDDDEEDDRSLCSFGGFDIEPAELSALADAEPEANVACCGDDGLREEVDTKPEEDKDEKLEDLHAASETSEEQQQVAEVEDRVISDEKRLDGAGVDVGQYEEAQDLKEQNNVESEDADESSSNKDIKFIDSKVDFSRMTYDKMCEDWEGNLRPKTDAASCLEERLAELHLPTAAQRGFETENEDATSQNDTQSSGTEGISLSAFESYIRGMTRAQSDAGVRPKPKSFIRPVMTQQTIKKTDPVAKYFQYKQLWEMFKLPGENDRRTLRLDIKERLAYQPPPPKPRRVYVPNTYIVPTEKKRSSLRWEVRNDLANGLLPYKLNYRC